MQDQSAVQKAQIQSETQTTFTTADWEAGIKIAKLFSNPHAQQQQPKEPKEKYDFSM